MGDIYSGKLVIVTIRENIVINQSLLTESLMIEYAEACFKRLIRYWKMGSEKSNVCIDDVKDEIIDILVSLTNPQIPIWNQHNDINGLIQDDAINTIFKIIYAIEDYIRHEWFVEESRLERIDIKIMDKKYGIISITPYFRFIDE